MSEYNNLLLGLGKRKEYLSRLKEMYSFFYILMQKVEIKQLKINKLKEKVNEEFKKIYLLDAKFLEILKPQILEDKKLN